MDMASDFEINQYLQAELERRGRAEVSAVEAAKWLDAGGRLRDSKDRPGRELRRLLRNHKIIGARREMNNRWFIDRQSGGAG